MGALSDSKYDDDLVRAAITPRIDPNDGPKLQRRQRIVKSKRLTQIFRINNKLLLTTALCQLFVQFSTSSIRGNKAKLVDKAHWFCGELPGEVLKVYGRDNDFFFWGKS